MENKAIFLCGPTAVGKTDLAIDLAQYYPIEIISVDSALIYRDLNIGSAKPSLSELNLVPHHLIDIISPLESYSVMEFLRDCNRLIVEINQRGNIPVLVGGTMMYFNALINGISQLPEASPDLRSQLNHEMETLGNEVLHQRLMSLDPITATRIAVNDSQRLQRALEICLLTGKPMSVAVKDNHLPGLINCNYLPLAIIPSNRELLHQRINLRFEKMLLSGFLHEVEQLKSKYPTLTSNHNSMRCVGYRQVLEYLENKIDYSMMVDTGQAATRQLAKRQITWLRSMKVIAIDDNELLKENLMQQTLLNIKNFTSK